jgi:hypothetical protein
MTLAQDIGADEPVPLELAVKLFYQHAGITKHTLLAEIARGRLEYEQTGRKKLVTFNQIEAMRKLCRVPAKVQDSISGGKQAGKPSMSLSTERMKKALDSIKQTSKRLKSNSTNISPANNQMASATVHLIKT